MKLFQCPSQCLAIVLLYSTSVFGHWWDATLDDLEGDFDEATEWFENQIAEQVTEGLADSSLGPGILAQIPLGYSRTPRIRASPKTSHVQSEITVALYNNDTDDDSYYVQPPAFNHFQGIYEGYNDSWLGIALDSFDAEVEVEIDLSKSAEGDYTISLLKKSATVDGIGVEIEFQLYMTAQASAEMSFTAGLELSLKNPAALMIPALDPILNLTKSELIGFNTHNFELSPIFNATMPQLEFSTMLALRTIFSVDVEGLDVGALTLDLPAFNFNVETKQNMLANCQTPPPGTPADQIYGELIHLSANLDVKLSYELLEDEFSGEIDSWPLWNGFDKCYAFLPGSGSIGPVPASSKDSILTEKPVTTCTTGGKVSVGSMVKSLSPGIKAAVAVGILIGVSLIVALGFCLGRASQRHDIRKHGFESMNGTSNYASGGFLHRSRRVKSEKDGFGARMPVTQVYDDAAEAQMQQSHRIWPRRKPVPFIMVDEASIPSSTDLPIVDDGNNSPPASSRQNIQEPSIAWNGNHLETSRYWGPGDVTVEGQGLLREQRRQSRR